MHTIEIQGINKNMFTILRGEGINPKRGDKYWESGQYNSDILRRIFLWINFLLSQFPSTDSRQQFLCMFLTTFTARKCLTMLEIHLTPLQFQVHWTPKIHCFRKDTWAGYNGSDSIRYDSFCIAEQFMTLNTSWLNFQGFLFCCCCLIPWGWTSLRSLRGLEWTFWWISEKILSSSLWYKYWY